MEEPSKKLIESLSEDEALEEAKLIISRFRTGSAPVSATKHDNQGLFSITITVTLEDKTKWIVQLKDNEIDTTRVALARSLLGDIVPFTFAVKSGRTHYAYVMSYVEGEVMRYMQFTRDEEEHVFHQIGSLISRCSLNISSAGSVDDYIVPRLQSILDTADIPCAGLRNKIVDLLQKVDTLKALPLALCHVDINNHNVCSCIIVQVITRSLI